MQQETIQKAIDHLRISSANNLWTLFAILEDEYTKLETDKQKTVYLLYELLNHLFQVEGFAFYDAHGMKLDISTSDYTRYFKDTYVLSVDNDIFFDHNYYFGIL